MAPSSCLLPPPTGAPFAVQHLRPEPSLKTRGCGTRRPHAALWFSVSICPTLNFSVLAAPTSWPINIFFVISKTKLKKKKKKKNSEASEGWGEKRKPDREVQSALRSSLDATKQSRILQLAWPPPELDWAGLLRPRLSGRSGRS